MFSRSQRVQILIPLFITTLISACGAQDEGDLEQYIATDYCLPLEGERHLTEKPLLVALGSSGDIYEIDPSTKEFKHFEIENNYSGEIEPIANRRGNADSHGITHIVDSTLLNGLLYFSGTTPNTHSSSLIVSSGTPEASEKIVDSYSYYSSKGMLIKNNKMYVFKNNLYGVIEIDGCYTKTYKIEDPTVVSAVRNNEGEYKKLKSFSNYSVKSIENDIYIQTYFHDKSSTIYYLKHNPHGITFEDIGSFKGSYVHERDGYLSVQANNSYTIDLYEINNGQLNKVLEYTANQINGYDIFYPNVDTYESKMSIKLSYKKRDDNQNEDAKSYLKFHATFDDDYNLKKLVNLDEQNNNATRSVVSSKTWNLTSNTVNNITTYVLENIEHSTSTILDQFSYDSSDYYEGDDKALYYWSDDQKSIMKYVSSSAAITSNIQIDFKGTDNYRVKPRFSMPLKDEKFVVYGYTFIKDGYDSIADKMHFGVYDLRSNTLTNKITTNTGIKDDSFITSTSYIRLNDHLFYFEASSFGSYRIEDERAMFIVDFGEDEIVLPSELKVDTNLLYQLEKSNSE